MDRWVSAKRRSYRGKGDFRPKKRGNRICFLYRLIAASLLLAVSAGIYGCCSPGSVHIALCKAAAEENRQAVHDPAYIGNSGTGGYYYERLKSGLNGDQEGVMFIQEARSLFMEETNRRGHAEAVNVGVLDTLFTWEHEDLKYAGLFYNCRDDELAGWIKEEESSDEKDQLRHGTHVAGIIGAINNNGLGIDGVYPLAYDRKNGVSHLYGCSMWFGARKDDENGRPARKQNDLGIISCLEILFENDVKVINFSMGNGMDGWDWFFDEDKKGKERKDEFGDAIAEYLQGKLDEGKDFVIVTSAGNDSDFWTSGYSIHESTYNNYFTIIDSEKYPEVYDRILVVGNCTTGRNRYSTSNSGERVDLWAVGVDIYSTVPEIGGNGSSKDYGVMTGTSQASPYVAGTAAMVWTLSPGMKGSEVKKLIVDTSSVEIPVMDENRGIMKYEYRTKADVDSDPPQKRSNAYTPGIGKNVLDAEKAVQAAIDRGGWGDEREIKPAAAKSDIEYLEHYVRMYLMPLYGQAVEGSEVLCGNLKASDVKGLIGWDNRDYDGDGQAELVVLRSEYDETDGKHDLRYLLEVYEIYSGTQVTLQDRLVLENGIRLDVTEYPNIQAGLFSYQYQGTRNFAWGLDAYTDACSQEGHVFRTGIVTYNGRYLEEIGEYGFGDFPEVMNLQSEEQRRYEAVANLVGKGLACLIRKSDMRVRQVVFLNEKTDVESGFENHFNEIFNVLVISGSGKAGEDAQLIAEQNITLRIPEIGEEDILDITVWPAHPKPAVEALDITMPTPREAFLAYLAKEAPNWDIMPTEDLFSIPESGVYPQHPSWDTDDLYGFLASDIRDYDGDGKDEMLLVWVACEPGEYSQAVLTAELQIYEYSDRNGVKLQASQRVDMTALFLGETLYRPEQFNLFVWRDGDTQMISADIWESMNDTVAILANYEYDGKGFRFRNGLSCEKYGQGDYIIRSALKDPADIPAFDTIWTCLYNDEIWQTEYAWYTDDHDYAFISEEELDIFRGTHKKLSSAIGLPAAEEIRSGFMAMTDLYAKREEMRDVSAKDVYTASEGSLTDIASVIVFCDRSTGDGRYVLHRRDWQGSLDEWRK